MTTEPISEAVHEINFALKTSSDVGYVREVIERRLRQLREHYRAHRDQFTADTIAFLRKAGKLRAALDDFTDLLERKKQVHTRKQVTELALEFAELATQFAPYRMSEKAGLEARELVQLAKRMY